MLGLGIVGLKLERLCLGCELVHGNDAAAVLVAPIGEEASAVAFLPPLQVHNTKNGDRTYLIDPFTARPRFGSTRWVTNGSRLYTEECGRAFVRAPGVENTGRHPFIRAAPGFISNYDNWNETDDPSEALSFVDTALVPCDEVEHWDPQESLDASALRREPLESMPAVLKTESGCDNESYRIRAAVDGKVVRMTPTLVKIKPVGRGAKSIPRLDGLDYAVQKGQEVKAGQLLFTGKEAKPNTRGYKAMVRVWRRRMFISLGDKKYVRMQYVKAFPNRCPVCFADVDDEGCRYCAVKRNKTVKGLPMVRDLRLEAGRRWIKYTGDSEILESMIPSIYTVPSVLALTHDTRRRAVREILMDNRLLV